MYIYYTYIYTQAYVYMENPGNSGPSTPTSANEDPVFGLNFLSKEANAGKGAIRGATLRPDGRLPGTRAASARGPISLVFSIHTLHGEL